MKKILLACSLLSLSSFVLDDSSSKILILDKKKYKQGETITGKAYIYAKDINEERTPPMGYGAYDQEYAWIPNAVSVRPVSKNKKPWEYVHIANAIQVKNDTAYFSFKVPEHLLKKSNTYELKIERTWHVAGRDTTLVKTSRFKLGK